MAALAVAPLQDSRSVFGNHNVAAVIERREGEPHPYDARGIFSVHKEALGSGVDGEKSASTADFAGLVQSRKSDWLTSRQAGEVDGLVLITRQGRKGDAASLLFNGQKVKGTGTDTGGMTGLEGELRWVTQTGAATMGMHLTMGILEGAGGSTVNTGNGFVAEASEGVPFAAFAADGFKTGAGALPTWQYLLWGSATRSAGDVYASIDGTGNQFLKGDLRVNGSVIAARSSTPRSSTSPCTTGQSSWDANYEYRCVAPNTWKRAALSGW
ncbi:hypothetical protein PQI07_19075 [Methylobacterium sp. 092160098-2]|uniref:hypothetical protein n=1 Tax=Methylobacterium sp. 092160098-2 TaxID=3025129 RepID=UPI002381A0B2|nr:hypothetical protein [Methylobacterium sp. 092160098-2]MDE4912788.1 hypothetical protein [Methylobacterium sp. 092160098-2]